MYTDFAHLKALKEIQEIICKVTKTPAPKTYGAGDFTGYSDEVIQESIDALEGCKRVTSPEFPAALPGPLGIVYKALVKAQAEKAKYREPDTMAKLEAMRAMVSGPRDAD